MITINNTDFSSSIDLAGILVLLTKAEMLDICKRLDLYVSPNLKKEETARRLALELLDSPVEILSASRNCRLLTSSSRVVQTPTSSANHARLCTSSRNIALS